MIWLILTVIVVPFAFVLLYGAPYLPTRKAQANRALDLLKLKEGDIFVDLGSGDGAVLIEAAKRGLVCYGYELNPLVWLVSKVRTFRYGKQVKIYCSNFWDAPMPLHTKGVFVFLLEKYMKRLDQKLTSELQNARVVSYTFQVPGKKPLKSTQALYLYKY